MGDANSSGIPIHSGFTVVELVRVGCMNLHLVNENKRRQFIRLVLDGLDICAVTESWLKDSNSVMGKELMDTNWQWFGRDRIGKRGGGIGFLVNKRLKAKILSNCESTLWIQIGGESMWCIAVVYLLPKDSEGNNRDILGKLQQDIIRYRMVGKVLILGDFNGRIEELPNRVVNSGLEGIDSELVILRTSKDKSRQLWKSSVELYEYGRDGRH